MIDYEKEVTMYGRSLSDREKNKARAVFNELLAQGHTFEWLYYAIKRLDGRSILEYPYLLFYHEFQEEVDELVAEARAKKERDARICAAIEKQIQQFEEYKKNIVVIHRQRKPKVNKREIDLALLAEMEDEEAPPTFEKTDSMDKDSTKYLIRSVRGY